MSFTNSTNTTESLPDCNVATDDGLDVSYQVLEIFQIVNHVILSGAVCLVGMVVNIINMIIFVQQGLDNTSNIGMFAISLSDCCSLVTLEWFNINSNPFMKKADVPFVSTEVGYLTGAWHACFLQITIWITIYVTAERFLCIAFPLKVKQIVTPFRTRVVVTCIYLLMFISVSPIYVLLYFKDRLNKPRNETRVGIREREVEANLEHLVYIIGVVIRIVSFITLTILTCMLVITLKSRSDWRMRSTVDGKMSQTISARDAKTMKMVSLIALVLIICSAPAIIVGVNGIFFNICDRYARVFHISWSFAFLSEAINSNVNIFFFYKMSTKFRRQFKELFAKCRCFF